MQPPQGPSSPSGQSRRSKIPPLSATQPEPEQGSLRRPTSPSRGTAGLGLSNAIPTPFTPPSTLRPLSTFDGRSQSNFASALSALPDTDSGMSSTQPLPLRSPRRIPPLSRESGSQGGLSSYTSNESQLSSTPMSQTPLAAHPFSVQYTPLQLQPATPLMPLSYLQQQPHPYAMNQSPFATPLPAPPPSYPLAPLPHGMLTLSSPNADPIVATQPAAVAPATAVLPDITSLLASVGLAAYVPSFYQTGFSDVARVLSMQPDGWNVLVDVVSADMMLRRQRGELAPDAIQPAHRAAIIALLITAKATYAPLLLPKPSTAATKPPTATSLATASHSHTVASSSWRSVDSHFLDSVCHLSQHWCCCLAVGAAFLIVSGLAFLVYENTTGNSVGFDILLKVLAAIGFVLGGLAVLVAVRSWKRYPEHRGCQGLTCCDGEEEEDWCWTKWACYHTCQERCDELHCPCSHRAACPSCSCRCPTITCCAATSSAPCCSFMSCTRCCGSPHGPTCADRVHDHCQLLSSAIGDVFTSVYTSLSLCLASVLAVCMPKPGAQAACCPTCPTCPTCPSCSAPSCGSCLAPCRTGCGQCEHVFECCGCHHCCDCCEAWCDDVCGGCCDAKHCEGCGAGCSDCLTACRATICYKLVCCQFKIQVV